MRSEEKRKQKERKKAKQKAWVNQQREFAKRIALDVRQKNGVVRSVFVARAPLNYSGMEMF